MDEFLTKNILTRRKITSVVARIPDILGRLAPLTLKFKHDLRKLIVENPEWDDPINEKQILRWKTNILIIEDVKEEEWTITRKELGALNVVSNVKAVVERKSSW